MARRWYLLIHQLPPDPLYLRAKIRQRLARVGAVALKNAVYVLPRRDACLEDFQWIAQEAAAGGGQAYVCEAEFVDPTTEAALVEGFRSARNAEYETLAKALRGSNRHTADRAGLTATIARGRNRLEEIGQIDYFKADGRRSAESLLARLQARSKDATPRGGRRRGPGTLRGRTWVTRSGVHIDRIASAWLIRRFTDPKARFRFVDPREPARPGELRFDMVGGDFTHEGDRCTFETLLAHTGGRDTGLRHIAEIVHDIDLKDGKFG
ncbi:MAG: chromate resistance protein ChrB domain-containing protein, partial [Thermoanaerobaculia bacterium]